VALPLVAAAAARLAHAGGGVLQVGGDPEHHG
jgi:hypothetical protein